MHEFMHAAFFIQGRGFALSNFIEHCFVFRWQLPILILLENCHTVVSGFSNKKLIFNHASTIHLL